MSVLSKIKTTLINKILNFIEKRGRKYAVISPYSGELLLYKYFLFFDECEHNNSKYPNILIHEWISEEGADLGIYHKHPWSFISILLNGSYIEERNNKQFFRNSSSFIFVSHKEYHKIYDVRPGTISILIRSFKKSNFGVKDDKIIFLPGNLPINKDIRRGLEFIKMDERGKVKLARRQAAFKKIQEKNKEFFIFK